MTSVHFCNFRVAKILFCLKFKVLKMKKCNRNYRNNCKFDWIYLKTTFMKNTFWIAVVTFYTICSFGQGKNEVTFQAEIANKNGDVIYIKDKKDKTIKEIKIDKKGIFKDSFKIENADFYVFFDGTEYTQLFLKNGYDLKMKMDAKQFDESIVYTGVGAAENNYLAQDALKNEQLNPEKLAALSEVDFKKMLDDTKLAEETALDKSGFDATFVSIQKKNVLMNAKGLERFYNESKAVAKLKNTAAPLFDYLNHKGGTTKLAELIGLCAYIEVWATWCGTLRAEIPSLKKIEEKYHGKNIEFVSISVDVQKDFEKWKKFVTDKQLGGIQLFADKDWNSDFIKSFGINSIPRFILIDPKGNVVSADAARPSDPKLQEELDTLLK